NSDLPHRALQTRQRPSAATPSENRRATGTQWRKSRCTEGRKGHEDRSGIGFLSRSLASRFCKRELSAVTTATQTQLGLPAYCQNRFRRFLDDNAGANSWHARVPYMAS